MEDHRRRRDVEEDVRRAERQAAVMGIAIDPRNAQNVVRRRRHRLQRRRPSQRERRRDMGRAAPMGCRRTCGLLRSRSTRGRRRRCTQAPRATAYGRASTAQDVDRDRRSNRRAPRRCARRSIRRTPTPSTRAPIAASRKVSTAASTWQVATTRADEGPPRAQPRDRPHASRARLGGPAESADAQRRRRPHVARDDLGHRVDVVHRAGARSGQSRRLTAGTSRDGVLATRDGGTTWTPPSRRASSLPT